MPTLQTVLPQPIIDAVQREASSRKPQTSKSRVAAEVLTERFGKKARKSATPEAGK